MSKFVVMATWDDVPHLTAQDKADLWNSIPPFQRDARSKGIPQLGSGAIFPIQEEEIKVDPFKLPREWPRVYALDVGWNKTAAVWGAWDRDSDIIYLYSEWYRSQAEPAVNAVGIKSRGDWIWGVIDPSARGRSQVDGGRLIDEYVQLGLNLDFADNSVEAGIMTVWERLSDGRLKVFSNLSEWFGEYRIYRRDEKGKIVKSKDHLMDCTRYLVMSGLPHAITEPFKTADYESAWADRTRSAVTGY